MPVMDTVTGKTLEHFQLRCHSKYKHVWNESYSNKQGRLFQGRGNGSEGPKNQRIKGTETFQIIRYDNIPSQQHNKITYTKVVCEYKAQKEDPNQTWITIGSNCIFYPGDVGTPTGFLELVKLVINSVLSCRNVRFVCFDIRNFYIEKPMDRPEYVRIRLYDIPKEFIAEYNLITYSNNGWIYFEITKGCYGLSQACIRANTLLRTRLNKAGYHETTTMPGL